jgi:hypothetical protein
MVLDSAVLDLLDRLGTAKAMSWFKSRVRAIAQQAAHPGDGETPLRAVERALSELGSRPSDDEQPRVTLEAVQKTLGGNREAARAWIRWAETAALVVRGAQVHCRDCGAESWRQMWELAPPIPCRGCGRTIAHPYPEGELKFQYRASEPLLRVIEHDALPHLLAMRFFCTLWRPNFDSPTHLFGAYPGVDIYDAGATTRLGEADVLLVFSDGALVPGECKRRGAGLNTAELTKLDALADRLGSPWSFAATPDWAYQCPSDWRDSIRFAPHPSPRLVLTAEQLLSHVIYWPAGSNIFAWDPASEDTRAKHNSDYLQAVLQREKWLTDQDSP